MGREIITEKITISKEQAKIIASAIALDIRLYIEANRAEYEAWLKEQDECKVKNNVKKEDHDYKSA